MSSDRPTLADPPPDPFRLFAAWYQDAAGHEQIKYAAAACLSTVAPDGLPDGRTVLLEVWDAAGFVVFTDVESVKGRSLARFPEAALTFYWGPLDRQIRVRGGVAPEADAVADACFDRRPLGSRITAWASPQSRVLSSPADLERRVAEAAARFAETEKVPRPPHWRAYRLAPRSIEFWEARAHRLHERLLYSLAGEGGWTMERLYP